MPYVSLAKQRMDLWRAALSESIGTDDGEIRRRIALVEAWRADYWAFLTGKDLDGTPIIWTVDERDDAEAWKPFPGHRPEFAYLRDIAHEMFGPWRIWLADKARQVYATTLACQLVRWYNWKYDEREVFVSRVKEESAIKMINDKIRKPHARMPQWVQRIMPISAEPKNVITWTQTGSTVTGVAQNFAEADARGPTASLIIVDEAAYQSYFQQIYKAILPMTGRMWGITTANIGNPGAALYEKLIHEGKSLEVEVDEPVDP